MAAAGSRPLGAATANTIGNRTFYPEHDIVNEFHMSELVELHVLHLILLIKWPSRVQYC